MSRATRFLIALFRYGDVHYARRLLARAASNMRLVLSGLGSEYVRVDPSHDFSGVEEGSCERFVEGEQPPGLIRTNLAAYHLALPHVKDCVVVDAGTNEGYGAALFATSARQVHAFDISADAIERARTRYSGSNIRFEVHDLTQSFPLASGSADVVFSSEVIEHLADGPAFLAAARDALRPGGRLIIKTPNDDFNRYENRLNPHHVNCYDAARLTREVAQQFVDVKVTGLTYRTDLETHAENRFDSEPVEKMPYRFGEPIEIDRVLVTRMRVTPQHAASTSGADAEYLWATATRPEGSVR